MKSARFFRAVWRFNAIVISVLGLAAAVALVMAIVAMTTGFSHSDHGPTVADAAPGVENAPGSTAEHAHIGVFENIAGTTQLRAALQVWRSEGRDFSSKSGADEERRNYLYFDTATHSAHWLAPDNETIFLGERDFPGRGPDERNAGNPVRVTVFELRSTADTGLHPEARESLAIADPDGRRLRVVARDITEVNAMWLDDADHLAALYSIGAKLFVLKIDLKAGSDVAPTPVEVKITRS